MLTCESKQDITLAALLLNELHTKYVKAGVIDMAHTCVAYSGPLAKLRSCQVEHIFRYDATLSTVDLSRLQRMWQMCAFVSPHLAMCQQLHQACQVW